MAKANVSKPIQADFATPPGYTLKRTLDALAMTQLELAKRMGRPIKTISEIVSGKTEITPETALQLEKVLGIPAKFWLERESQYREHLARVREEQQLHQELDLLDALPVAQMVRREWIPRLRNKVQTLRALYSFFGVAGRKQLEARFKEYTAVAYRQSAAFPVNEGALCAWLRKGEIEAAKLTCSPFSSTKLRRLVSRWRSLTGKHLGTIYPKLRATAADSGIAIVLLPELSGSHTSGAVRWLKGTKQALIQLSLRYATDDLFWFNLFHEVGHLLLHSKDGDVVEDLSPQAVKEEEANRFAADQLIPPESYRQFLLGGNFDRGAIRDFADQIQIAPSIVLGRLQHDRKLQYNQYNDLKLDYKEQYKSRGT